jgi:hypothetical protein
MMRLFRNGFSLFLALVSLASAFLANYSHSTPTYIALATDIHGSFNRQPVILGEAYAGLYAGAGVLGFMHHSEVIDDPENASSAAIPPRSPRLIWDHSANPAATLQGSASLDELSYAKTHSSFGMTLYDGDDDWLGGSQNNRGCLINVWIFILAPPLLILLLFAIPCLPFRRSRGHNLCPDCRYDLRVQLEGRAGANCPECGRAVRSA